MLGRLGMDIDGCIAVYKRLFKNIFEHKSRMFPVSLWSWKIKPLYSSKALQSAIVEVITKDCHLPEDTKLNDHGQRDCHT